MKAIIVEDEINSRKSLEKMIAKFCPEVAIVSSVELVSEAIEAINIHNPDLIFLDIELPDQNGFKLFEYFPNPDFEVIFTTAYGQYAINALKMAAVDYLLKPIDLDEIRFAIKKVNEKRANHNIKEKLEILKNNINSVNKKLALPTNAGFIFIPINDIVRCEAQGNYTFFHTQSGTKHIISKTLRIYEEVLQEFNFVRISRSQIINLNYVKQYGRQRRATVTMDDGTIIPLSASRKENFLKKCSIFIDGPEGN